MKSRDCKTNDQFICIKCGARNVSLVTYVGPHMELTRCRQCGNFVSEYVEYEAGLLTLDLVLLKLAAFRHLLENSKKNASRVAWRVALVYMIIATYLRGVTSMQEFPKGDYKLNAVWYLGYQGSGFELFVYSWIVYALASLAIRYSALMVAAGVCLKTVRYTSQSFSAVGTRELLIAFCIADFGKLISVLFVIWTELSTHMYANHLLTVYLCIAHTQALRAKVSELTFARAFIAVGAGLLIADWTMKLVTQHWHEFFEIDLVRID